MKSAFVSDQQANQEVGADDDSVQRGPPQGQVRLRGGHGRSEKIQPHISNQKVVEHSQAQTGTPALL